MANSLTTETVQLAERVAQECKALRTLLNGNAADLSALDTTDKASLVAAVNELVADIAALEIGGVTTEGVRSVGGLMDDEVSNLAAVKAFDPAAYATAAQGSTADSALQPGSVVNDLTTGGAAVPLSAAQGVVLKGLLDAINTLLTSDETTLDTLQEIVDYIQLNRADLDALGISSIAGLQSALDGKAAASHTHALTDLDIDGGTDIGADLADADLIIVDDGAGGTNRKSALSRVWTYTLAKITANAAAVRSAINAAVSTVIGDYIGPQEIDSASNAITFDLDSGNQLHPCPSTGLDENTTITLTNIDNGQSFCISGFQDSTGGRSITLAHATLTFVAQPTEVAGLAANDGYQIVGKRVGSYIFTNTATYPS